MPVRVAPVESSAPHLTSASIAFLFTARQSTRRQKSQIEVKRPALLARRADRVDRRRAHVLDRVEPEADVAAALPAPCETTKSCPDSFTSGGSTSMPISSQHETKNGTLSLVDMTDEISAAMYSAG